MQCGVALSCCMHTCSCSITFREGRAICLSLSLGRSPGLGSYQEPEGLLLCSSGIYAYLEGNAAPQRVPTSATVFALGCAGFFTSPPKILKKCLWMFRVCWVSHPHSRVVLQGVRREEHCREKMLLCSARNPA